MGNIRRGYIIPSEPLPEDDYCMTVYIPKNTEYLIQFFTALGYFGKWNSWKRVGDNLEKDVADRWKVSIEKTHDAWANGGCEMFQLRQSDTNPCQLEQSLDGGETWALAFDYGLTSNCITVPAPYPGSETGASDAAAAAMTNVFKALTDMVDCEGQTRSEYITAATAYMRTFDASYANPTALGAVYDAFCELDEEGKEFWKSDCPFDEHKDEIEACAGADGLFDWLNCGAETINNWLNSTSDAIMDALNAAAAALSPNGWQNTAGGGAGGGSGFGADCGGDWSHAFNFAIDEQGWEAGGDGTYYNAGNGWNTGGGAINIHTGTFSEAVQITRCVATVFYYPGSANPGMSCTKYPEGDVLGQLIEFNTVYDMTCDDTVDVTAVMVSYDPYVGGGGGTGQLLIGVTLYGTGVDPF